MTHSHFWSTRAIAAAILLTLASCKKASRDSSDDQVASLLFDVSSPAAREALAIPVDFRLTDANYSQWEQAQRFFDALPRSAFSRRAERERQPDRQRRGDIGVEPARQNRDRADGPF